MSILEQDLPPEASYRITYILNIRHRQVDMHSQLEHLLEPIIDQIKMYSVGGITINLVRRETITTIVL